ncbi:hypothetical protein F5Y18DRAFT_444682 [Xylariaceae sp. FL1019]|nr:hypothetical protein F5Y18DRAFT_444682 [Xylariaceae sp. FL1019]
MSHSDSTGIGLDWLISPEELSADPTAGLKWVTLGYTVVPEWVVKPTPKYIVAAIKAQVHSVRETYIEVDPKPLPGGNNCKVYDVRINGKKFVIRVMLPNTWYPGYKIETEVATMRYARQTTELRPPIILGYQSTRFNPLGYEWLLMSKIPGRPLSQVWSSLSYEKKERLVERLASCMAKAINNQMNGYDPRKMTIGSLYDPSTCSKLPNFPAGVLNTMRYHIIDSVSDSSHFNPLLSRPFSTPLGWGNARIAEQKLYVSRASQFPVATQSEKDKAGWQQMLSNIKELRQMSHKFLKSTDQRTILWHNCLSKDNIFVDEDGNFTGTVDWQDQPLTPLYDVCQFPAFLQQSYDRVEAIQWERYATSSQGRFHPLAFHDHDRYELTGLRRLFIIAMQGECPLFIRTITSDSSRKAREFDTAVANCTLDFKADKISDWIQAKKEGRLTNRLYEDFMETRVFVWHTEEKEQPWIPDRGFYS